MRWLQGVVRERVRQIEAEALTKLRAANETRRPLVAPILPGEPAYEPA